MKRDLFCVFSQTLYNSRSIRYNFTKITLMGIRIASSCECNETCLSDINRIQDVVIHHLSFQKGLIGHSMVGDSCLHKCYYKKID